MTRFPLRHALALVVLLGATSGPALATTFNFNFSDTVDGVYASGALTATANGDGTYTATAGEGTVSGSGATGVGSITLVSNPTPPSVATGTYFSYDDQLLPGQDPAITAVGGLLFDLGGVEVNIYANGPGSFQLLESTPDDLSVMGSFTLAEAPVPEPMSLAVLGVGLAGLGLARRRRYA